MPQLDLVTYTSVNLTLFLSFWIYFAVLYVAVSYTMQKIYAGVYFKFYMVLSTLITVYSVMELHLKDNSEFQINFEIATEKNTKKSFF